MLHQYLGRYFTALAIRYSKKVSQFWSQVEFWTDANGRQMVRRIKDFRFSYNLVDGDLEPVSSNYYPVTSGEIHLLPNGLSLLFFNIYLHSSPS